MNKETLIKKLEDGVTSLRDVLDKHDGSTLQAIGASAKQGFDSLKSAFDQNETAQKAVSEIKKHVDDLETAIRSGDKELSGKLLSAAEKKIQEYKEKQS